MSDEQKRVLVVGGGLTGLTAAVFLAWHGVSTLVVERHTDTLLHPRARGINPRSVELLRQVGLEEDLHANLSMGVVATESADQLVRAETLAAEEYVLDSLAPGDVGGVSPCSWCAIDQDRLEVLLRKRATELGADIRFGTELAGFEQGPDGVTAVLRDLSSGNETAVTGAYLIAADGWRSGVRTRLGVRFTGPGVLMETLSVVFEADLEPVLRGRRPGLAFVSRPVDKTIVFPHDGDRAWVFGMPYYAADGTPVGDVTEEQVLRWVREAVGVPGLDVTLKVQIPQTGAKILSFPIGGYTAERFRSGRVFLAGDAARMVPPSGAFGGSSGIADAHNLAWKLASVLRGEAGEGLLDTYEEERRPVSLFTLEQAMARMVGRGDGEHPGESETAVEVDGTVVHPYWSVVFGYRYRSAAVLGTDPHDQEPVHAPRELRAQPGSRAPHLPLVRDGREISALDLFGEGWVLLAGEEGAAWVTAAEDAAARRGLRLTAHRVGGDVQDPSGGWPARYGVEDTGAVLVRPDGFVAWRSAGLPPAPRAALERALDSLLQLG
ncbi:FAD-dependent oxidoreductase [Streptomyces cinerochromogenes]|uniref:FAD-dependent oxidoreductase n=1 Tax=Streptomyces cinerochromogenes TaxID=66422 RepID=UPI0016715D1D|nr:FAD-dependent oxidoreductase [Streptomyces cinerochromogenes]GGS91842.1 FAD-dependent oxidoreductase [Streptomyces cinerochromogenes]